MIHAGANVKPQAVSAYNPLYLAVIRGLPAGTLKLMIEHGADWREKGQWRQNFISRVPRSKYRCV